MKYVMLAVLWASVCCVVIPINGQAASKNPKTGKAKPADSQPPKIDAVSVDTVNVAKLTVQQQAETKGKPADDGKESKSYLSRLVAPENLPNLILCAVGIAGVVAAVCTLKFIARQTHYMKKQTGILIQYNKATRDAADAAKNSLAIMQISNTINLESLQSVQRAYISFSISNFQTIAIAAADTSGELRIQKRELRIAIDNTGNTPAIKLKSRINFRWQEGESGLRDDFGFPDLGNATDFVGSLAAKGLVYSPKLEIEESVIQNVYAGKCRLFLYGWAEYNDVFTGTVRHRTDFCYEFKIRELTYQGMLAEVTMHHRHNAQT